MSYLRERWTEEEVLNLPAGEHDYFERKSGRLLDDQDFRAKLSKALSAFANSGGGHIVLGLTNDGKVDGVPIHRERTPISDWFEQIITNLLIYPLKAFRVHVVERRPNESTIPADKTLIVIDVGDSPLAPHQAAVPKDKPTYYYRAGSHSLVAPHFYLEALRTRFIGAQLLATYEGIRGIKFWPAGGVEPWNESILAEVLLCFKIENLSREACYKWVLDWSLPLVPQHRPVLDPSAFESSHASLRETQDAVILPSRHLDGFVSIAIPLATSDFSQGIFWVLSDTHIQYRAISEYHVPDFCRGPIAGNSDRFLLGDQFRLDVAAFLKTQAT